MTGLQIVSPSNGPCAQPHRPRRIRCSALLALFATVAFGAPVALAQTNAPAEEFTAFAINMGVYTRGTTANLIITVNRWTSEAEKEKLFALLREKGQAAFLDALQDTRRVGTIRTPQSVGYDLRLALEEPTKDGGRRILIATDRPVSFAEATGRPRTIDYPFTIIEMLIPKEGKGQGTMSVAARLVPAGKTTIIENFDTQPVRLNEIESRTLEKR
jgi:hypothetical protein